MQKLINLDVSRPHVNEQVDIVAKLGQPCESITVVSIPSGVTLSLNWGDSPVPVIAGAIIIDRIPKLWYSSLGTSADPVKILVSDSRFFYSNIVAFTPVPDIEKGLIQNQASPGQNMPWFANDLLPSYPPAVFRIYACIDTAGKLRVERYNPLGGAVGELLNGGNDLTAGAAYIFDVLVSSQDTINLSHSASSATILFCQILELRGGK